MEEQKPPQFKLDNSLAPSSETIPHKSKNWLIIVLILLLLSSLSAAFYFAYKYNFINKQINEKQVNTEEVLPPSSVLQLSPLSSAGPFTNWQTYNSDLLAFTVKHPEDWYLSNDILTDYDLENYSNGSKQDMLTFHSTKIKCDFAFYNPQSAELINEKKIVDGQVDIFQGEAKDNTNLEGPGLGAGVLFLIQDDIHDPIALLCFAYNKTKEKQVHNILSTLEFNDQVYELQIKVREPFFPQEVKERFYNISYDGQKGDQFYKVKGQEGYDKGIEIVRDDTKVNLTPVFEGTSVPYNEVQQVEKLVNKDLSLETIYRIKSTESNSYIKYVYVNGYESGESSCTHLSPKPMACSMSNLLGFEVYCETNLTGAETCDQIVGSLSVTSKN